jgi:DNA-binding MarR family transcriptional regulator
MCVKNYENIELLIMMAFKRIIKTINTEFEKSNLDLNTRQWHLLNFLYTNDGCSQQSLANIINKDKATIKRAVDNLCKKGLVWRQADSEDKRLNLVYLTDYAKSIKEKVNQAYWITEHKFVENIPRDEIVTTYNTILQMMQNIMDESSYEELEKYLSNTKKNYIPKAGHNE